MILGKTVIKGSILLTLMYPLVKELGKFVRLLHSLKV